MPVRTFTRAAVAVAAALALVLTTGAAASAAIRRDRTPPTQPANLRGTAITHTSVTVAWDRSTDNVAVTHYAMWVEGLGLGVVAVNHPQTTATWSLALRPGVTYQVGVQAWDASYNGSPVSRLAVTTVPDITAPSAPSGLSASAVTASTALLSWASAVDAVGPVSYEILVSGVPTANALSTRSPGNPSGPVSGAWVRQLSPGTAHQISVRARDGSGNVSAASNAVTVTTLPSSDPTPPSTPTLLSASDGGTSYCPEEIWLRWAASTDNVDASTAIEYEVRINGVINEVARGATQWVTYTEVLGANAVTIVAVDAAGNASAPSNVITPKTNWGFGSGCAG